MEQYTLHYVNEFGDTILKSYFTNIKEANESMGDLIKIYQRHKVNRGLILYNENGEMVRYYEPESENEASRNMKVKVLNFLDYDYGTIMDTFVFTEDADIEEIKKTVLDVFEKEEGIRPYCDIVNELYGYLMLNVIEREEYNW